MKKILSFIVVLLIAILLVGNVKAKSSELEITNVEILEKSDSVKANIENYKDLNINLDTLFFNKDDYVKYKISIKNNTNNTMKIDDILDNFNSEVLETSYDIDKKELKSKEEYTFTMTIKCIKDIEEERVTINTPLNIIINYDNGKTAIIDINPNTKDNIINFFIIFILSAISLIVIITKRGKKQLFGILLLVSLIPIGSNAVSTKKELTINNDITIYGKTAVFKTGKEVNQHLKELAGTNIVNNDAPRTNDTNITGIRRTNNLPDGFVPSEDNIISTSDSRIPIYAWFDNGTIYYYTEANNPLTNEDASWMFANLTKLNVLELDTIDTSNTIDMSVMFQNLLEIEDLDILNFNTSNVQNMSWMFGVGNPNESKLKTIDLSNFNTSNVTDMSAMFANNRGLEELDLSSFDTSSTTNMSGMFVRCVNLENLNVNNFDTSNVTDMSYMFRETDNLDTVDLSSFNTSNVETMLAMFYKSNIQSLDLSSFDTKNVTDMGWMFFECEDLKSLDVSNFDVSKVTNMKSMFCYCSSLEELDLRSFTPYNVTDMSWMFSDCTSLKEVKFRNFDTRNVTTMYSMFANCNNLVSADISSFDTSSVTTMSLMFYECKSIKELNVSGFNTANVTDMSGMFMECTSLEELDVSKWNTGNVTKMNSMFCGSSHVGDMKIKYLDVSKWDVSNVTDMTCMFYGMGALEELDVSNWDVSKVQSFNHMFCDNFKLKSLNLTRWDVSSVKTMYNMFDDNYELTTVGDISHWNTDSLIDVGGMFNGCKLFIGVNGTIDLSGWNTSKINVTGEMFRNVAAEVIDLRGWDLSSITDSTWSGTGNGIYYETGNNSTFKGMAGMFKDARNLTNIYVDNKWSIPSGVSATNMFSGAGVSQVTVVE